MGDEPSEDEGGECEAPDCEGCGDVPDCPECGRELVSWPETPYLCMNDDCDWDGTIRDPHTPGW